MQVLDRQALNTLFLGRLARLVVKESQAQNTWERALVSRAILSTYRDCRALGVTAEAERVLSLRRIRPYSDI